MAKEPVDNALFAELLADFEQGKGEPAPFDLSEEINDAVTELTPQGSATSDELADRILADPWTDTGFAFVEETVKDTDAVAGGKADPESHAYAGFLQGLCIGYWYAQRKA